MPEDKPKVTTIGDCVLNFTANADELDKSVTQLIERMERALAAFKAEWNRKD